MAVVYTLFQTQEIMQNQGYSVEQIGKIFVASVCDQSQNFISKYDELTHKAERNIKKKFQKHLRQDFYFLKNEIKINKKTIDEAIYEFVSPISEDLDSLIELKSNKIKELDDNNSIEGALATLLYNYEEIAQRFIEGAKHYKQRNGIDRYFDEYDSILEALR